MFLSLRYKVATDKTHKFKIKEDYRISLYLCMYTLPFIERRPAVTDVMTKRLTLSLPTALIAIIRSKANLAKRVSPIQ